MILEIQLTALNKWFHGIDIDQDYSQIPIVRQLERNLALTFLPGAHEDSNVCMINSTEVRDDYKVSFTAVDLLDYIYATLHWSAHRKKYEESVYNNYSEVSGAIDPNNFWHLVGLGRELRQLHLLESPAVRKYISRYPIEGSNEITTRIGQDNWEISSPKPANSREVGRILINKTQYFDTIPLVAWEFCIAGYRPAQKWLKDRRGRVLTLEDILSYHKIISALTDTHRIRMEIDSILLTTP